MLDEEPIAVDLSEQERVLLRCGLLEWWGPASPTDDLARAMGFGDKARLSSEVGRLMAAVEAREPLPPEDWRRVLLATEIVFASDVVGSGLDWPVTTGLSDTETITLLRGVQRKLPRWRSSMQFTVDQQRGVVIADAQRPGGPEA